MRLQCPKCGTELFVDDDDLDQIASCTGCRAKLRVPAQLQSADTGSDEEPSYSEAPLTGGGGDDGKYEDLVDMTAMVDIVFFLLIFFMITTASGILSCIGMPAPQARERGRRRKTKCRPRSRQRHRHGSHRQPESHLHRRHRISDRNRPARSPARCSRPASEKAIGQSPRRCL